LGDYFVWTVFFNLQKYPPKNLASFSAGLGFILGDFCHPAGYTTHHPGQKFRPLDSNRFFVTSGPDAKVSFFHSNQGDYNERIFAQWVIVYV
jgi:hypothetical protein